MRALRSTSRVPTTWRSPWSERSPRTVWAPTRRSGVVPDMVSASPRRITPTSERLPLIPTAPPCSPEVIIAAPESNESVWRYPASPRSVHVQIA